MKLKDVLKSWKEMANICENTLYVRGSEETLDTVSKFIMNHFDVTSLIATEEEITVYFNSRWVFPEKEMNALFNYIEDKKNLYMRCLSVEYGCLYHALWYCTEDGWNEA